MDIVFKTYVRWRRGESRRGRVFAALDARHPAANTFCLICNHWIGNVEKTQLVAVGPDDAEDRVYHDEGSWYTARALIVHERCLRAVSDEEVENFCSFPWTGWGLSRGL